MNSRVRVAQSCLHRPTPRGSAFMHVAPSLHLLQLTRQTEQDGFTTERASGTGWELARHAGMRAKRDERSGVVNCI